MTNLPTGTVTFMFTDIEGSTKIAQAYPDQWETLRRRHHEILRGAIHSNNGYVFQIVGDEFCSVFHTAPDALNAAYAAQQMLQTEDWNPAPVKVRMGINTGAAQAGDVNDPSGGYTGYAALARVNRVMSAGHGGQVLLSNASADLVRGELPENVTLLDMGEQRMRGLLSAEHLWQMKAPGLAYDFPPLKTLTTIPNSQAEQLASFVEHEKEIAVGLEKLEMELPQRAPVLMDKFQELAEHLRPSSVERTYKERFEALKETNDLCMEALDISFIMLCTGEALPAYDARCPFRGLESFRPEDSEFFFGREVLINKLVGKIRSHPFLAVLGASGSGKSSLVMAGLIPALNSEYVIFRPGSDPLVEWETALSSVKENALIVVDQFEEIFTLTSNEVTCREFITKLLGATRRYKVIITLRSDFLGEVAAYRALNEEIQNHLENVPPMDMDELYQSMAGQAGKTGLRFEADLGQQILDDVVGEPGAMPLLQHALWMLWKRRHGFWLKSEEYQSFGGVRQAIASTAEDAYASCSEFEQARIRDIFLRLTRLDENNEGRDTRRRVPLNDLIHAGRDAASNAALLDTLANARLIVKTFNEDKAEIEVAHEALIRHWERLRAWLNEDRDNLRLRESVSEDAREWENAKRDESLLNHRGARLELALAMSAQPNYLLNPTEQAYLNACVAAGEKTRIEKENQQRRELELAKAQAKAERRARLVTIGLLVVTILVAGWLGIDPIRNEIRRREAMGPALISIPKSEAIIGDARNADGQNLDFLPPTTKSIEAFDIEPYEVTNKRYLLCVESKKCSLPIASLSSYNGEANAKLPVVNITAIQASQFCEWIGRQLPSDEQWERAARHTDGRLWPWGSATPSVEQANFRYDAETALKPVGEYENGKSEEKAYDLAGNVWEWMRSAYDPSQSDLDLNSAMEPNTASVRGGSYNVNYESVMKNTIAYRLPVNPFTPNGAIGFRCVSK